LESASKTLIPVDEGVFSIVMAHRRERIRKAVRGMYLLWIPIAVTREHSSNPRLWKTQININFARFMKRD
jgi:hypothetical protein